MWIRAVANHHGLLLAHVQRTGSKRGVHDLIIAATARAAERTVLTTDERARFGGLPEVTARTIRVAGTIRTQATTAALEPIRRAGADICAPSPHQQRSGRTPSDHAA